MNKKEKKGYRYGQAIRSMRRFLDYSQEELAKYLGCTQAYLSLVENGSVSMKRFYYLCGIMGYRIEYVVQEGDKVNTYETTQRIPENAITASAVLIDGGGQITI